MKAIITVTCPDCKGTLEIDVAREKVLAHRIFVDAENPNKDKAAMFDEVVENVKEKQRKGLNAFDEALDSIKESDSRLDDLFGDMKKKIQDQKDSGEDLDEDPRQLFWD